MDCRPQLTESWGQDGRIARNEVSEDDAAAYSFGTRLGHLMYGSTGFSTYLIPAALGGTRVEQWLPTGNRLDRATLFGSSNYRAQVSAALVTNPVPSQPFPAEGGPVTALIWYQGESDANTPGDRSAFVSTTNAVMNAFDAELGVDATADDPHAALRVEMLSGYESNAAGMIRYFTRRDDGTLTDVG